MSPGWHRCQVPGVNMVLKRSLGLSQACKVRKGSVCSGLWLQLRPEDPHVLTHPHFGSPVQKAHVSESLEQREKNRPTPAPPGSGRAPFSRLCASSALHWQSLTLCSQGKRQDAERPVHYVKNGVSRVNCEEGNGTPIQYSCLENPMDGGAWWAAVRGVAKSRIRLSDFTFTFHFPALKKEMATHPSVLAWRIPGMGEPDGLPSMGSHRVGHD